MEKITDEDLKNMLTKTEENPEVITNEETGEAQWVKLPADTDFEDTPMAKVLENNTLQDSLEQEIDFNTIPENIETNYEEKPLDVVLEKRNELTIGLTPEDIQALFDYIAGKGEKPLFVDKFMSDTEGRLKEMSSIMTLLQLSRIPVLTALTNQVQERLFDPSNLYDMDSKTLSATMTNLNKDIMNILDVSIKTVQNNSQFGSLNNEYRKLLDSMMMLPADKLDKIRELVMKEDKSISEK